MPAPVLYSTNSYFACQVAEQYRNGIYYAWCSESFSATSQAKLSAQNMIAASSDPRIIYQQLHQACRSEDGHDSRIKSYKRTFRALAKDWRSKGEISQEDCDDIITICNKPSFQIWRPVLFVIPREKAIQIRKVAPGARASAGDEFIVEGIHRDDFDRIELPTLEN